LDGNLNAPIARPNDQRRSINDYRNFPESWYRMKTLFPCLRAKAASIAGCAALLVLLYPTAGVAQRPQPRIVTPVNNASRVTIAGTRPPIAQTADAGAVPGTTQLQGVSITFSLSDTQQSALDALIAAQQNPASPQYHQWLTPAQYAAQFGAASSDLAQVQAWLQTQGLTVEGVSRNQREIKFSGSVAQLETAFGSEIHYYNVGGQKHFAPAKDLTVPAAFGSAVLSIDHLTDLKPHSHLKRVSTSVAVASGVANSHFTSAQTGTHYLQPGDVAVIYDINAAYNSGYTGIGQTIAVVGQSEVVSGDIANFQTAAGVPVRAPQEILIPGTGNAAVSEGDEEESDLDLEYTSSIARGASITFIYTGNSANSGGAFESIEYAVQNRSANIISSSYGNCEAALGTAELNVLNSYLAQAAAQGQTVVAAAGDDGSADCYESYGETGLALTSVEGLAVDFPGSSQYVTSMGGTELPAADVATSSTYFKASTGSDVLTSALTYIPEVVWNDSSAAGGLSSGGGGVSIYTPAPTWQSTTVPGLVANSFRQVPDLALDASPNNAGYLLCSSDPSSGITGSCSYGFRDSSNEYLTVAGGTSFSAPIFSAMLAIINQSKSATTGAGLVNPTLYTLASNAITYSTAFHDIQTGTNECASGTAYALAFTSTGAVSEYGPPCSAAAAASYAAHVGYDNASGLGSVDLNNLLTAWPGTSVVSDSRFTLSTTPTVSVGASTSGTATITVTPANGYTGTVAFSLTTAPLISGACYTLSNASVSGTTPTTAVATIYTAASLCPTGAIALSQNGPAKQASVAAPAKPGSERENEIPAGIAMAALLGIGLLGRRSRQLRGLVTVALLALGGVTLSGCGSSSAATGIPTTTTTTTTTTPGLSGVAAAGTYTVTVTGEDTTSGQQAMTTFSLTIQ
jgi:subtilase family serine protease